MIETQAELTADAVKRGYRPEALVFTIYGDTVQVTSWPWFEGSGGDKQALIMARSVVGDATTNRTVLYFSLMKVVGSQPLEG